MTPKSDFNSQASEDTVVPAQDFPALSPLEVTKLILSSFFILKNILVVNIITHTEKCPFYKGANQGPGNRGEFSEAKQ